MHYAAVNSMLSGVGQRSRNRGLKGLWRFCEILGDAAPTQHHVQRWIDEELARYSTSTMMRRYSYIKMFCRFIKSNCAMPDMRRYVVERRDQLTFRASDYTVLSGHTSEHDPDGLFRCYVVPMLWWTGMRWGDMSRLKHQDLNLPDREISFIPHKTAKRIIKTVRIPMTNQLHAAVSAWINQHPHGGHHVVEELFEEADREAGMILERFHHFLHEAGFRSHNGSRVGTQTFRRTFISRLIQAGVTIEQISHLTGQNYMTVLKYYNPTMDQKRETLALLEPSPIVLHE